MQQRARIIKNHGPDAHLLLGRKIWVNSGHPKIMSAVGPNEIPLSPAPRIVACYFIHFDYEDWPRFTRQLVFRSELLEYLSGEDDFREDQEDVNFNIFLRTPRDEDEIRWLDDYLRTQRDKKERKKEGEGEKEEKKGGKGKCQQDQQS